MGRRKVLPISSCTRSVAYFQQPAIGLVAIIGPFGEDVESDIAAFHAGGEFAFDEEAVIDRSDRNGNFFLFDLYGDAWEKNSLGSQEGKLRFRRHLDIVLIHGEGGRRKGGKDDVGTSVHAATDVRACIIGPDLARGTADTYCKNQPEKISQTHGYASLYKWWLAIWSALTKPRYCNA